MEPDPQRERETPIQRNPEAAWSRYDEIAAQEETEWRKGRRRRRLVISGIVLLVMCLVGSIVGYVWYDRATRIDRSTPVVVVFQYVDTIFTSRDIDRAKLFECDGTNPMEPLLSLLGDIEERERKFNVIFIVKLTDYETEQRGAAAKVKASIDLFAPMGNTGMSQVRQPWLFELKDEDGWRVCRAAKQES